MDQLVELNKVEIVKMFNDELITFISELLKILNQIKNINNSEINTIMTYKNLIQTGIIINKEIGIEMFSGYIYAEGNEEFCEKISSKDYNFFYKIEENLDKTNQLAEIIFIIKNLFVQLSEQNKENIFGYLDNLSILSNVYFMKKIA